ncbi:MAG: helix-turn-helix domain-containing protein [Chloroflexi bacterium]|nr:helix-turn-helix domain-containing protein [Chloroflexota bacterium]
MTKPANQYRPDYAVPPGWILEEYLETRSMSQAELARRCGCSPKLISGILAGVAPLSPKIARQFEKVLGLDATVWLGIEYKYRCHELRAVE